MQQTMASVPIVASYSYFILRVRRLPSVFGAPFIHLLTYPVMLWTP